MVHRSGVAAITVGLLAQAATAEVSPWVSTGIFGAVLSWLLFVHLPAKDKQLKELLEMMVLERKEIELSHKAEIEKMLNTFKEEQQQERAASDRRHSDLLGIAQLHTESLRSTRHAIYDTHESVVRHNAVVDMVVGIKRGPEKAPVDPKAEGAAVNVVENKG